jgi:hypothetical protein
MRLLKIRTRKEAELDYLMRELAPYSPIQLHRAIVIDLQDRSDADILDILTTVQTCITAHKIPSARLELDGLKHRLAPAT